MSQPPLSQQIHDLERELGVELFRRTRRSVTMTVAGRAFLAEARHVLGDARHAVEIAQKAAHREVGRLSIGFGPTSEGRLLKQALSLFLARHPDVQVDLHSLYTHEQLDALAHRKIQVALPLLPISSRGLIVETIAAEPLLVALPAGHPLVSRERVPLSELRNEPFVVVSRSVGASFDFVLRACAEAGFKPRVTHQETHILTVLGLVAARRGVTLVSDSVASARREGVVFRPLAPPVPKVELGLAYRRDDTSSVVAAFRDVVREAAQLRRVAGGERPRLHPVRVAEESIRPSSVAVLKPTRRRLRIRT